MNLSYALREEGKNEPLFAYLVSSIRWLDACRSDYANFHLVFLIRLSRSWVLSNLEDYREGSWFDMLNACFVENKPLHGICLSPEESSHICQLARMTYYETMFLFGMNRMERQRCLTVMMEYYRLHLPEFPELKSLDVLKELFA